MTIETFIENINGRYNVQVGIKSLTASEEELVRQFGAPIIEVGGEFTGTVTRPGDAAPTTVTFSLPTKQRRLPTDFPTKEIFDLQDDEDSDIKAKVYADEIVNRLTIAKQNLIEKSSAFAGETTITI